MKLGQYLAKCPECKSCFNIIPYSYECWATCPKCGYDGELLTFESAAACH